jgi:hypothetical protein
MKTLGTKYSSNCSSTTGWLRTQLPTSIQQHATFASKLYSPKLTWDEAACSLYIIIYVSPVHAASVFRQRLLPLPYPWVYLWRCKVRRVRRADSLTTRRTLLPRNIIIFMSLVFIGETEPAQRKDAKSQMFACSHFSQIFRNLGNSGHLHNKRFPGKFWGRMIWGHHSGCNAQSIFRVKEHEKKETRVKWAARRAMSPKRNNSAVHEDSACQSRSVQ